MMRHLLLLLLFLPTLAMAKVEMFQIVVFDWDDNTEQLKLVSLGSGTAVGSSSILTNKHVVQTSENEFADLLILCQSQAKAGQSAECNIAAGVAAAHPFEDVALVRPIESAFFPQVRLSYGVKRFGDSVRVNGFPTPNGQLGFGDSRTLKAFEYWIENPKEALQAKGDKLTVTRGQVQARLQNSQTDFTYTKTNAKVNFGNSGGAVFDEHGAYLGIVTYKDNEGNSIFLEYHQIDDWVKEYAERSPSYETAAYQFYQDHHDIEKAVTSPAATKKSSIQSRLRFLRSSRNRSTYSSPKTSQKLTPTQRKLYEYLRQKRAKTD